MTKQKRQQRQANKDYTPAELEFMKAVEGWRNQTGRSWPSDLEVLGILKALGYRKVQDAP